MTDYTKLLDIKPPNITHIDSKKNSCIQAVDFIAGAIHCMYRDKNDVYYKKIKSKITIALDFFDGKNKNYLVNPSLLRPTRLRAASSFSGRTYSLQTIWDYRLLKLLLKVKLIGVERLCIS